MEHGGQVRRTGVDGHGRDEKARKELLSEMVKLRETRQKTRVDECKDSSTLKQKTDDI